MSLRSCVVILLLTLASVHAAPVRRQVVTASRLPSNPSSGAVPTLANGPLSWLCTRPVISKLCSNIGHSLAPASGSTLIATPSGPVYGALTANGKAVRYTIPYAQPPVGSLRFADPVKVTPWSNKLNASSLPPACPQSADSSSPSTNENCLFMNIFAPASAIGSSKLPVFVWTHGGSNLLGSSTAPGLDGSTLAVGQSMIVVTLQYRLGVLGFFSSPSLGISGNQAVKDVVLALSMVRSDILSYGGDPNRVTLAGQSSGASLISTLLTVPSATTLFQRAIIQSAPLNYGDQSAATAAAVGSSFASALGCSSAACLRSAGVTAILDAQATVVANAPLDIPGVAGSMPLRPSVDGTLIKGGFMTLSSGGLPSTSRPIIFSTVRDEAAPTIGLISGGASLPVESEPSLIAALAAPDSRATAVTASGIYMVNSTATNAVNDALTDLGTDGVWRCANVQIAVNLTASRQAPAVYYTEVQLGSTYPSNAAISYCAGRTCHEDDIFETFGNTPSASSAQSAVQTEHIARWAAFVKAGSPNAAGLSTWSPIAGAAQTNTLLMGSPSSFVAQLRPQACGPAGLWGRGAVPFDAQIFGP